MKKSEADSVHGRAAFFGGKNREYSQRLNTYVLAS